MPRSIFHDIDKNHRRPFVAEHNPTSASPSFQIIKKSDGPQAEAKINSILRATVDLSATFAARWFLVIGAGVIEVYLVAHHIAIDGKSMSQLSQELLELLAGKDSTPQEQKFQPFYRAHLLEDRPLSFSSKERSLTQSSLLGMYFSTHRHFIWPTHFS
ncbi:hypothetical protein CPB84DRAFT_1751331 [Gymnopilus junonius]|uniref:Condensation domain-containing protein n=1 Tax=Gymnopilus junonius TaxID=109634 RepID=A0A9P5NCQ2_GYMJU|nr:hypothetical protein CPB84DRAFT_1751331 [Gymnopilus junonius]